MTLTLALVAALAATFTPLLLRDTRRADARRRTREWLRTSPDARNIVEQFENLRRVVGEQMEPSLRQAATALARFAEGAARRPGGDA